jgi:putative PIN family toxin of toxin-antitoxin system
MSRRVTAETNVYISGLLFSGPPRDFLQGAIEGKIQLFLSPPLFDEIRDVLFRPKFALPPDFVYAFLKEIEVISTTVFPKDSFHVINADPEDNRILECAWESKSDCIVTGDNHLLQLKSFKSIPIVSPALFLSDYYH